jgi:hypothetical protein
MITLRKEKYRYKYAYKCDQFQIYICLISNGDVTDDFLEIYRDLFERYSTFTCFAGVITPAKQTILDDSFELLMGAIEK